MIRVRSIRCTYIKIAREYERKRKRERERNRERDRERERERETERGQRKMRKTDKVRIA